VRDAERPRRARARGGRGGGCTILETALRGISLRQLKNIFPRARALCVSEGWPSYSPQSGSWDGAPIEPDNLNLYELVHYYIEPQTKERKCSMVELIADGPQPPDYFVSHWWGESQAHFIACLEQYVTDHGHLGVDEDTYFWVCAYANNQHELGAELDGDVRSSPFVRAIALADGMVTIADGEGAVLTRAWCAYESFEATVRSSSAFTHDIYTAKPFTHEGARFVAAGLVNGLAASDYVKGAGFSRLKANREAHFPPLLVGKAAAFDLREAEASRREDLLAIMHAVGGSVAKVNATVRARFRLGLLPQLLEGGDMARLRAFCSDLGASELRALSLYCAAGKVSAAAMQSVVEALPPALLDVRAYLIGNGSASEFARLVASGQLLHLELWDCGLGVADGRALGAALAKRSAKLRHLQLNDNNLGAEGAHALTRALARNSTLTALELRRNGLGDEGTAALARALALNSTLASLDLRRNEVGDAGASALASALARNTTLTALNLRRNEVGDEGAAALARALARNVTLTSLDARATFPQTAGGDAGASALRAAWGARDGELKLEFDNGGDEQRSCSDRALSS
jgi:hypothetical protein